VYALGCVLYEMLAGEPPFSASTAQAILAKILTMDAPSITMVRRTVPPNVGNALAQALEKLPADRFTSASEFAAALSDRGFTYEGRRRTSATDVVEASRPPGPAVVAARWNSLTVVFAATTVLMAVLAGREWFTPSPALPVTRAVVDAGGLRLSAPGDIIVSPDGRRMALIGAGADGALRWRNADAGEFQAIPGTEGTLLAAFSPDGESLVFTTTGGTLERVAIAGGAPQLVVTTSGTNAGGVDWGDDDNIVFTQSQGRGLYRVPSTGGEIEELLESGVQVRNPRVLPEGRGVIFTDPLAQGTRFLDIERDSVWLLRPGAIDAHYVRSGHLLYSDMSGTLVAVRFNPDRGEVIGEPVVMMSDVITMTRPYFARFSVSDDAATLVYGTGGGAGDPVGYRMVMVSLDDEGRRPLALTGREIADLDWSVDERSIVYRDRTVSDPVPNIYTYDLVLESTPLQLTFEGDNQRPVFSPDGSHVVFSSRRGGTDGTDLFVKALDDDAPARLLISLPGDQFPPHWPLDTLIAFESGTPSDLWTLSIADANSPVPQAYLTSQFALNNFSLSPDGTLAAYGSFETGAEEIFVRSFPEAGERTPISEGGGRRPHWAPDGETLFYWSVGGSGLTDTFLSASIRIDPFPVVEATDSLFSGDFRRSASDLSRSGDRLLVGSNLGAESGDGVLEKLVVVANFFEELNRLVPVD
jgi:serine/threonine-protein kinase